MTCPIWLSLHFYSFCHLVVRFIHLVFRRSWELNSHPRIMAQTVSPRHSLLDQGASFSNFFMMIYYFVSWSLKSKVLNLPLKTLKENRKVNSWKLLKVNTMIPTILYFMPDIVINTWMCNDFAAGIWTWVLKRWLGFPMLHISIFSSVFQISV